MQCFPSIAVSQHRRDRGCDVHFLPSPHVISEVGILMGLILFCWPHSRQLRLREVKQPIQQHTGLLGRSCSYL